MECYNDKNKLRNWFIISKKNSDLDCLNYFF